MQQKPIYRSHLRLIPRSQKGPTLQRYILDRENGSINRTHFKTPADELEDDGFDRVDAIHDFMADREQPADQEREAF